MTKLIAVVALLLCLGLWDQNASAGVGPPSLVLTFAPTDISVDGQTTLTSTLTATVINAPPGGTFNAVFTSPGFTPPDPIGPFNPTMSPGVCSGPGSLFLCSVMNLDFTTPGTPRGTFTFTTTGTVNMGSTVLTSQAASFDATVPEPGALALLSLGLVALGVVWRKSAGAKPG